MKDKLLKNEAKGVSSERNILPYQDKTFISFQAKSSSMEKGKNEEHGSLMENEEKLIEIL